MLLSHTRRCWVTPDATEPHQTLLSTKLVICTERYHCLSSQTDVEDIFYNDKYNDDNDDDDDDDNNNNDNNNNDDDDDDKKYLHCVVLLLKAGCTATKCHVVWKLSRLSC